jgi:hypothetical protein
MVGGQPRSTQRRRLKTAVNEAALTAEIVRLTTQYSLYGYRRIRESPAEGQRINVKWVYRICRQEGQKAP